jgi:hypothetical protein
MNGFMRLPAARQASVSIFKLHFISLGKEPVAYFSNTILTMPDSLPVESLAFTSKVYLPGLKFKSWMLSEVVAPNALQGMTMLPLESWVIW